MKWVLVAFFITAGEEQPQVLASDLNSVMACQFAAMTMLPQQADNWPGREYSQRTACVPSRHIQSYLDKHGIKI